MNHLPPLPQSADTPDPGPVVDRWLTLQHQATRTITREVLNIQGGLNQALLGTRHAAVRTATAKVLDVDAGLNALLSFPVDPQPSDLAIGPTPPTDVAAGRPKELSVTSHRDGDRTVIAVTGGIDADTAPSLRERLNELVASGHYNLVVDIEGVESFDAIGLQVLVDGLRRVRSHDGTLRLVCAQERILDVFRITRLTMVFPIHASLAEALADTSVTPDGSAG
jgi:anti-sigma B factor antagonist